MKLNCLVSIIIPVYNGENYLRQAIDSALAQTYKNIEVIVVNDGSTDNTEGIALSYGDKIRYFNKENGGCASALNYGISVMKGEYFSWLSHDDLYSVNKIEKQLAVIADNNLDENTIISCGADIIDKDGEKIFYRVARDYGFFNSKCFFERLFKGKSLNGCALLIHRGVLEKVGRFNETLIAMPDWEYWVRIALAGFSLFRHSKDVLVSNRVHKGQVSTKAKLIFANEYPILINQFCKQVETTEDVFYAKTLFYYCIRKNYKQSADELKKYLHEKKVCVFWGTIKNKIFKYWLKFRHCLTEMYWSLFRK